MKKIVAFLVLISSLFAISACSIAVSNTKVRVVALSYSSENTELALKPDTNQFKLLSNKLLADEVEEYIFPGDILTFTIELEDPNFEFISLLSIKFNDQIIRANVDNSIVTTRDCGANICVDFPFEISSDKSEYTVQEVKFAKLNSDAGVNAIIDNQSDRTVVLDIYKEEVAPYVLESVDTLNQMLIDLTYVEQNMEVSSDEWNLLTTPETSGRLLFVTNYTDSEHVFIKINGTGQIVYSENSVIEENFINVTGCGCGLGQSITITSAPYNYADSVTNELKYVDNALTFYFYFFESRYQETFFYNVGNEIYVNILGDEYLLFTLSKSMKIVTYDSIVR